ncbi:cytochrome C biosynthesis protein [Ferrimonas sediminicola]|uniref:Cytochrome C biosynthesis protein n=1 Tax=Ferrimonas sediminicola TaxID=2569538 RepID=A0A4U1BBM5_9GAMM|nr:cytochrome C biosynthesis protein [Ferrimonas sediminicola]TKB48301.1 cytochrome C biosynthesis protein [Ferrimonas sediminicola]
MNPIRGLLLGLLLVFLSPLSQAADADWFTHDSAGQPRVTLYFFWSETCPHCAEAHPFIEEELLPHYPWIDLKDYKVQDAGTRAHWQRVAELTGTAPNSVPFMAVCGTPIVGYTSEQTTGQFLENQLRACYQRLGGSLSGVDMVASDSLDMDAPLDLGAQCGDGEEGTCGVTDMNAPAVQPVELPLIGVVNPEKLSLPALTVVLAGVDAFNPCAFFVLLFLLSVMVNAKSRGRMLIVGGIFVFFSGLIYFLFMTAWLNLFQLLGDGADGGWIILAAGMLAIVAGGINIKEFFLQRGEISLSMSAENRTGLIKRMGKLSSASSLAAMIVGATVLAILANAYELLCTAGFPMIYTSVLSMHEMTDSTRYLYLVMYNVVYVIPLAAIVTVFAMTMGKRKLTEKEGQTLKLMSGVMMLSLGGTLAVNPNALQSPVVAIGMILGAIAATAIIVPIKRRWERRQA